MPFAANIKVDEYVNCTLFYFMYATYHLTYFADGPILLCA